MKDKKYILLPDGGEDDEPTNAEIKKLLEDDAKLTKEFRQNFETFEKGVMTKADYEEKDKKIAAAILANQEKLKELETAMKRPDPVGDASGETKDQKEGQAEYKKAFFKLMRSYSGNEKAGLELDEKAEKYIVERKALVSDVTYGQILLPEEVEAEIYRELPKINVIRKYATIRTIAGNRIRRRSLTEVEVGWGKLELGKHLVESDVVPSEDFQYVEDLEGLAKIGKDELADTDIALESIIVDSFGRAQAEKEETGYVVGTGHANSQPDGILNGTTVTRVEGTSDAITVDDLLDLIFAVPAQYRRNGVLMVPSTTELAMRKLVSAVDGQYLWQPDVQAGKPATFAGYPVEAQEDIPAIKSGEKCDIAIFGDFRAGYRILDRLGMTIQWLRELYITAGLIGVLVSKRVTGGVIRPDAFRILQEATGL